MEDSFIGKRIVQRRVKVNFPIKRHSRSASERESRLFLRKVGSPIKAFGDDEKLPVNTI
jgi:hypothetical protein